MDHALHTRFVGDVALERMRGQLGHALRLEGEAFFRGFAGGGLVDIGADDGGDAARGEGEGDLAADTAACVETISRVVVVL